MGAVDRTNPHKQAPRRDGARGISPTRVWSWAISKGQMLFFGQHRPKAAFLDLPALLASHGGYVQQAKQVDPPSAYLMAPYVGWVTFAGFLNEEVIRKTPRFLTA
jgi:tryptophan-rich sensory protein